MKRFSTSRLKATPRNKPEEKTRKDVIFSMLKVGDYCVLPTVRREVLRVLKIPPSFSLDKRECEIEVLVKFGYISIDSELSKKYSIEIFKIQKKWSSNTFSRTASQETNG